MKRNTGKAKEYIDAFGEAYANEHMDEALIADLIPHPNPKLWINPERRNFYDFTVEDFKLEGYEYEPFDHKFEVAV